MKTIILTIITVLSLTMGTYAAVKFEMYRKLPEESTSQLYHQVLKENNVSLIKVTDEKTTCYISFTSVSAVTTGTSISCMK